MPMPIGLSPKEKVGFDMKEFRRGKLHSGSNKGPVVKKKRQALAIALNEAGLSNKKSKGE